MRLPTRLLVVLLATTLTACGSDDIVGDDCCSGGASTVRVVNAFTTSVDVLVDGNVAIATLAAGAVGTSTTAAGAHTLTLRPTGSSGGNVTRSVNTTTGSTSTLAAVRASGGALSTIALDDTGSVVPNGATKVRVLHLAPNAGVLQVYRTQPDAPQPVAWQTPFSYQSTVDALSAPFYQSTPGTWEIRIWQTPADASGWASAAVTVTIPLTSGQKKTVIILDKPGGGVRAETIG